MIDGTLAPRGRTRRGALAVGAALGTLAALAAPAPAAALDAAPWDAVLRAHVRGGRVDYTALAADAEARAALGRFLEGVAAMPADAPLADWLNAYNATVVAAVLARYPIDSVKDVPGFFDQARHRIAGAARTLDQVENEVIRPRFRDPRVHFALNCAAIGCPPLHGRAFRQATLDRTLDRLARDAVRNARHVRRAADGTWAVSALFDWFRADFVGAAGSVGGWITRASDGAIPELPPDAALRTLPYDWRLADRRAR